MSGSGGGNYGGNSGTTKDCQSLSIRTQLASPKQDVLNKLKIGDILEVVLTPPTGPVEAVTSAGEIAGAIFHMDIDSLIQCISNNHEYQAKVIEIKGGNCQILIKHK
jgi:hypothetical protein